MSPARPSRWVAALDRRLYPEHEDHWDDRRLRALVLEELQPASELLDLGAGAGLLESMDFRGHAARIAGVDLDPRVLANPLLDEAHVASVEELPYTRASFDVVVCDNVLEHLEHPSKAFREVARVLRPDGAFLCKTPCKWHYVPTIARLTPHGFHQRVNALRGRRAADTFPTRYRANTRAALERLAAGAGLRVERLERVEGRPEYLRFHPLTYAFGWAWERWVNHVPGFAAFRVLLVAVFRKPGAAGGSTA